MSDPKQFSLPSISRVEVSLQISTGNTIYEEFTDMEAVIEFITRYYSDPQTILDKITPKKKPKKEL